MLAGTIRQEPVMSNSIPAANLNRRDLVLSAGLLTLLGLEDAYPGAKQLIKPAPKA